MGDAKRRGDYAARKAAAPLRGPSTREPRERMFGPGGAPVLGIATPDSRTISVRRCLMSAAGRCAVSFRVVESAPPVFMCAAHWRHVPESLREQLRREKSTAVRQLAAKSAILAVLQALSAIDGGSIPAHAIAPAKVAQS